MSINEPKQFMVGTFFFHPSHTYIISLPDANQIRCTCSHVFCKSYILFSQHHLLLNHHLNCTSHQNVCSALVFNSLISFSSPDTGRKLVKSYCDLLWCFSVFFIHSHRHRPAISLPPKKLKSYIKPGHICKSNFSRIISKNSHKMYRDRRFSRPGCCLWSSYYAL